MSLKDECIASLNDALADVKADKKGQKRGAICKLPNGDTSDPNNVMMVLQTAFRYRLIPTKIIGHGRHCMPHCSID
jgi:hypothetical protein